MRHNVPLFHRSGRSGPASDEKEQFRFLFYSLTTAARWSRVLRACGVHYRTGFVPKLSNQLGDFSCRLEPLPFSGEKWTRGSAMDCGTRELITTAHVGANGPERDSAALYPRLNSLAPPLKVKFSSGAKSEAKRPTGFRQSRGSSASLRGRSAFCSLSPSKLSSVQGRIGEDPSTGATL